MLEQRIKELELQLATASQDLINVTRHNAELAGKLFDAENRHAKFRQAMRRDQTTSKRKSRGHHGDVGGIPGFRAFPAALR